MTALQLSGFWEACHTEYSHNLILTACTKPKSITHPQVYNQKRVQPLSSTHRPTTPTHRCHHVSPADTLLPRSDDDDARDGSCSWAHDDGTWHGSHGHVNTSGASSHRLSCELETLRIQAGCTNDSELVICNFMNKNFKQPLKKM
ncbi:hypothetical protein WJX73_009799 [Symbiochloris irregularis]|uniref:Uncharacterized protein n=1 Tax=Symbiochloris irregularis TaxID=706552 RepID=A0AAW1NWI4_9CHLO